MKETNIFMLLLKVCSIAILVINLFFIIEEKDSKIANLETGTETLTSVNASLIEQIEKNKAEYEETIKDIVKTVQVTDSYLFVGGFSQEESAEWNVNKYEEILTMKSNMNDILADARYFFSEREEFLNDLPNIIPLEYSEKYPISMKSDFGDRYSPITGKFSFHGGIDLFSVYGAKVLASADGIVKDNWIYHDTMGRWVTIDHENGLESGYAHMAIVYVREGQHVKKGDVIGLLGNSGLTTGPHLHYSLKQNGTYVDPKNYIREKLTN